MKIFKIILIALLTLVLTVAPALAVLSVNLLLDNPYESSFVCALDEKFDRLNSLGAGKIILVGGSSVAFGVNSEILGEYTEREVVNFGLYAALGTKLMMDLSKSNICEGDIIVLTPEISEQTFSLYFNADTTLMATDKHPEMLTYIDIDDKLSMLGGLFRYTGGKLKYAIEGKSENPEGVYNSKNFNAHGDLSYPRPSNVMHLYYDPNGKASPDVSIITPEFVDYVNDYISYARKRGAEVYFNFCPINSLGLKEGTDKEDLAAFEDRLREELDCEILGSVQGSLMDAGYFYDTNFHLNDFGVTAYTVRLTKDLLVRLGIPKKITVEVPEAPPLPERDVFTDTVDINDKYFEYERLADGSYKIVGLSELGKTQTALTLPLSYNYRKVTVLGEAALSGGIVSSLTVSADTNITVLLDGCFEGAGALTDLWLYPMAAEEILPPSSFGGVAQGFRVHIPAGSSYPSDYYWSERGLHFVSDIKEEK